MINSCGIRIDKTDISGNWCSCSKNGDYIELHIKGNQYKHSSDFMNPTNWNKFEIKSDTLIQYDKYIFEDSILVNMAKFQFMKNGELELKYLISDEYWKLKRINKNIQNLEDNIILKKETIERSMEAECADKRTNEERKRDSLDMQIDFEF